MQIRPCTPCSNAVCLKSFLFHMHCTVSIGFKRELVQLVHAGDNFWSEYTDTRAPQTHRNCYGSWLRRLLCEWSLTHLFCYLSTPVETGTLACLVGRQTGNGHSNIYCFFFLSHQIQKVLGTPWKMRTSGHSTEQIPCIWCKPVQWQPVGQHNTESSVGGVSLNHKREWGVRML